MESRSIRLASVILLASLLVAGMVLLAACGGGSKNTAGAPGSTTGVAQTPKYGGTLRIVAQSIGANIGWPVSLNGGGDQVQAYYETLLHSDQNGDLKPWLAENYKVADDHKSMTFYLRKGVKFTDGSDLTADVVKWNLQQFAKQELSWGSIDVVDTYTVRVNFKKWDNTLPTAFGDAQPALYIVSEAAYEKHGQAWISTHPVGTGPFVVSAFHADASLKLVKNKNYWAVDKDRNKLPYLDEIDYTFTADPATTMMIAKAGQADVIYNISPGKQMAEFKSMGWRVNPTYDANEVWVPDSAHADSPWSKLEVREAAEYAIDRVTIAKQFGFGYLKDANQIPPRQSTAYQDPYPLARNYDPAKAKQLLTQAGYPKGFSTTLIVWPAGNKSIAIAEQAYLKAVGINAEIQYAAAAKWNSYVGPTGKYHNAILEGPAPSQGATGLGSVSFAMFLYGSNWQQPTEFIQAFGAATQSAKADKTLIRAATDILTKDALIIPVYEIGGGRVEQSYVVADFGHRGLPAFSSLETAWLNK